LNERDVRGVVAPLERQSLCLSCDVVGEVEPFAPSPIGGPRFSGTDVGVAGLGVAYVSHYRATPTPFANRQSHRHQFHTMRWLFSSAAVLAWSAVVAAKSFTGDRLLVVLEEQSEREKYSVFLEDLSCKLQLT
jgi:hypothetical protein